MACLQLRMHGSASVGSGWVACGAQGGCKGCVWGGVEGEVCIHYMLCDLRCTWWEGGLVCTYAGGLGVLQSTWGVRVIVQEG